MLAGKTVESLDFGSGHRMTFRQVLTEWLLENGKSPSEYLHESDVNKHKQLLGTWPRLQGLSKALRDSARKDFIVPFPFVFSRTESSWLFKFANSPTLVQR